MGDPGSIPGSGRSPGEGNGYPPQYPCLEKPTDGGAWREEPGVGSQRVGHDGAISLMKVKEESENAGLKLNTQKTKIMASGPITSWQIDGETMETVTDFIFSGSKITADGDCSHEVKKCLLLGRKGMTKLDNILKSRDITLPTKVCMVKAVVFPVVMYGCESWTIKKIEC